MAKQEQQFVIGLSLVQALVSYLAEQPIKDALPMYHALQTLPRAQVAPPPEPPPDSAKVVTHSSGVSPLPAPITED